MLSANWENGTAQKKIINESENYGTPASANVVQIRRLLVDSGASFHLIGRKTMTSPRQKKADEAINQANKFKAQARSHEKTEARLHTRTQAYSHDTTHHGPTKAEESKKTQTEQHPMK